jgi:hypothetical protein
MYVIDIGTVVGIFDSQLSYGSLSLVIVQSIYEWINYKCSFIVMVIVMSDSKVIDIYPPLIFILQQRQ